MSSGEYSVILADRGARDPMALAKALAAARNTPLQDQVATARKSWGIVAENLSREEAQSMSNSLAAAAIQNVICPGPSIASLPEAEMATTVSSVLAAKPALIAAAAITISRTTTTKTKEGLGAASKILSAGIMIAIGLHIKISSKERQVEKS